MGNIHVCPLNAWNTASLIAVVKTSSLSCVPLAKNTRTASLTVVTISTQRYVHQDLIVIFRRIFLGEFGKFFSASAKVLKVKSPLYRTQYGEIFSFSYLVIIIYNYVPVMFSTIKTPISFASEQLKTSTYGKRTNHF